MVQVTEWRSPGIAENDGTENTWSNPNNVCTQDTETAATVSTSKVDSSAYLVTRSYGFSIPSNHQIFGIEVEVYGSGFTVGGVAAGLPNAQLVLSGSPYGSDKGGVSMSLDPSPILFGGEEDLWDAEPTPAIINSPNFGFRTRARSLSAGTTNIRINYIRMRVYHGTLESPASFFMFF